MTLTNEELYSLMEYISDQTEALDNYFEAKINDLCDQMTEVMDELERFREIMEERLESELRYRYGDENILPPF